MNISPDRKSGASAPAHTPAHLCDVRLLPGECLDCLGRPRPYVCVDSWAGRSRYDVEVIGVTPKRLRVRFLADSRWHKRGDVRCVAPDVVQWPAARAASSPGTAAAYAGGIRGSTSDGENR